ncbi:uncharacterized protein A4U43_C01F3300 [Asparagus officinalis]|uniref:Uncharacterized protein n=1 Tax=Asparagus officinalis TaxID=4686 RepID=A0A5P1FLE2_ASPOF|nr:uncharacterized protein A4U43_C01F3300 [Asparagus officinalis]
MLLISAYLGLAGTNVRINLSASEINRLADDIIVKSKEVYDSVASVTLEKVCDFFDFGAFCVICTLISQSVTILNIDNLAFYFDSLIPQSAKKQSALNFVQEC